MRIIFLMSMIMVSFFPVVQANAVFMNGTHKEFYSDGTVKSSKQIKEGKNEGLSREYHPNGRLAFIQTVRNGKINGPVKQYYENGGLKGEVHFVDNLEEGVLKEYYENGKIMEQVTYIRGNIVNIKKFDQAGNLVQNQESNFPPGCKIVSENPSEKF